MHSEATRKRRNGTNISSVLNPTLPENLKKRKKGTENGELTCNIRDLDLTQNDFFPNNTVADTFPQNSSNGRLDNAWSDTQTFEDLNKEFHERSQGQASAGIIKKVFMRNFMCHRSFEVEFCPCVNVIQGPNGSGKSAVIAAVQVALGSKAFVTERGHSLSDLIFHGADYAIIRLRILNKLPIEQQEVFDNRYRPDLFKDAIVIQRKIFRNGASEWTLFDAENNKLEGLHARQEVERIVRHFNIYVENPATIVPQQRWKELLQGKKAEELYGFFLEATGLRNYERNLIESEKKWQQAEVSIKQKQEMFPSLQRKVKSLEEERGSIENLEQMKFDLNELEKEYAWRIVSEKEEEILNKRQEEEERKDMLRKKEEEILQLDDKIKSLNDEMKKKEEMMNEVLERTEAIFGQMRATRANLFQKKSVKEGLESERNVLRNEIQRITERLNETQHHLNEDDTLEFQQMTSVNNDINSLECELESLNEDYKNCCNTISRKSREAEELDKDLENRNLAIQKLKKEALQAEQAVAKWQRIAEGSTCERFGVDETLRQTIDRYIVSKRFHRPPIGPIGSYIKVKNSKWARAIQECIGRRNLGKFIVCDHHDRTLLTSLDGSVSVVVMNFDHDRYTLRNADGHSYRTVLSELFVDNPIVYNTLLDLCELDMNLLFDTLHECNIVAQQTLPNVKCCWSAEGKRVFMRGGGLFHTSYISKDPVLLTEDVKQAQKDANTKYESIKNQIQSNVAQAREIQERQSSLKTDIDRANERRRSTLERKRNIENKIAEKKQELEDLKTVRDTDTLSERRAAWIADKEEKEQKMMTIEESLNQIEKEIESLIQQEKEEKNELLNWSQKSDEVRGFSEKTRKDNETFCRRKSDLEREAEQIRSELEIIAGRMKELQSEWETKRNEAYQICEPLKEWKYSSLDEVKVSIICKREEIRALNEKSSERTLVQIIQELNQYKSKLQVTERQLRHLHSLVTRISNNITTWRHLYNKMHRRVEKTIQLYFALFMSHRGHKGELRIDRKTRTVSIKVSVASQRKSNGTYILTEDLKSLSGGERSYTTLSFMLALGEALQVPFRIFDEFDVFMDEGNRHTAYQIIFDEAKSQRNRQFIFLTPLHLPSVVCNKSDVRFITLQPPSRNKWMNGQQQILDESEYS